MHCKTFLSCLLTLGLLLGDSAAALAMVPMSFTHHGIIREDGALANGNYSITAKIYNGMGEVIKEVTKDIAVEDGYYNFTIDGIDEEQVIAAGRLELAITIGDVELSPRIPINSTPFSIMASYADHAGSAEDLQCAGCVTENQLDSTIKSKLNGLGESIGEGPLADNSISDSKISFNYAASSSKGGPASDLKCANSAGCVGTSDLENLAVSMNKLAADSVDTLKIKNNSILDADISDSAGIQKSKLASSVQASLDKADRALPDSTSYAAADYPGGPATDLNCAAAGCVGENEIASMAVSHDKLASDAVNGDNIENGSIKDEDISFEAAIQRAKLDSSVQASLDKADNALSANSNYAASTMPGGPATDLDCINSGCVGENEIANMAVSHDKLAEEAVESINIKNGSIMDEDIAENAGIKRSKLDSSVQASLARADNALTGNFNYAASTAPGGPATDLECQNPNGCISAADIINQAVSMSKLAPDSVDTTKIKNGSILDEDISASAGIQKSKLHSSVQASLNKADNALLNSTKYAASSTIGGEALGIADNTVDSYKIKDGSILWRDLHSEISSRIQNSLPNSANVISNAHITDGTILYADLHPDIQTQIISAVTPDTLPAWAWNKGLYGAIAFGTIRVHCNIAAAVSGHTNWDCSDASLSFTALMGGLTVQRTEPGVYYINVPQTVGTPTTAIVTGTWPGHTYQAYAVGSQILLTSWVIDLSKNILYKRDPGPLTQENWGNHPDWDTYINIIVYGIPYPMNLQ